MLTSGDGCAENQHALVGIRDGRVLDGMEPFFSTIMLFLSGWLWWTLNGSFRRVDQDMVNIFNKLQEFLGIVGRAFG